MGTFLVELPAELRDEIARRGGTEPGAEAEWVVNAVREKLAACQQLEYLGQRAARGRREAYRRVLSKVPDVEPLPGDER